VRTALLLVPLTALALGAAGCGGADEPGAGAERPGTGEAEGRGSGDIGPLAVGWSTDFSKHTVPLTEFVSGGPGKDGIPPIDEPKLVSIGEADEWLEDREPVIELEVGDDARAYPLQILIWHEIVNDEVGGVPVAVTFCPLCNTALVFDRRLDGHVLDFGTTGNLRHSDLVMYDRRTESWWQQFGGEAVVGELAGKTLEQVPARIVAWEDFVAGHPDGQVLSRETGHSRPYGRNPYEGYDDVDSPPFLTPPGGGDDRLAPKVRVVFLEKGGEAVAVPFSAVAKMGKIVVRLGGEELEVTWQAGTTSALDEAEIAEGRDVGSVDVRRVSDGERVAFDTPFWFAVAAFRPDVKLVPDGKAAAVPASPEASEASAQRYTRPTGRFAVGA
jgi:Protein of unknown function (DUF3179)